ncbi:MAG: 4-alpha-glucanotransferase, partial [Dehalococcoidia bacterium]|nr:4-alpha-glucanotransferase [Dehalococcoidia bacterium]
RMGDLDAGDYDQRVAHYHEYVQWLSNEQLASIAPEATPAGLYMDLPLGVHASGFDTWRFPESFAPGASAGAPPDGLFIGGQDWGFPPLHPERLRQDGYRYFIDVVRHHMRHARVLRVDHVMGLYRQYWIPQGFAATEGVYVRYPADQLAAILSLESHRHHCVVASENLGTVPAAVEHLLQRHGFRPMHVAQFGATGNAAEPFTQPTTAALAAIGTHDTPTFAGWWYGLDIHDKLALGLIDEDHAREEHGRREAVRTSIEAFVAHDEQDRSPDDPPLTRWLAGTLRHLAVSNAWAVLVNLEDLLLELQPQNVPGTHRERPNWLRKASATLEAMMADPTVARILAQVAALRHR